MLTRKSAAAILCAMTVALSITAANATQLKHGQCDNDGRCVSFATSEDLSARQRGQREATVIGRRPAGCPHRYCGCEASLFKFGRIIPELNLAANWIRKFAPTSPAPGMAAARRGHVMILLSHSGGSDWLVHDGNSGGGKTRRHVRSIRGYVVVDPSSRRMASR
jgi:hypothetical protein